MPLPLNPPMMPYVDHATLVENGAIFFVELHLAKSFNFWFWSHPDRLWWVGPYTRKRYAVQDQARYVTLTDGPELRPWNVDDPDEDTYENK